jgi:hypothetical protein
MPDGEDGALFVGVVSADLAHVEPVPLQPSLSLPIAPVA